MSETTTKDAPPGEALADDLLWGIKAIAAEIRRSERQTFHLVDTAAIPAAKVGGRIVASRTRLREHFNALIGAGRP